VRECRHTATDVHLLGGVAETGTFGTLPGPLECAFAFGPRGLITACVAVATAHWTPDMVAHATSPSLRYPSLAPQLLSITPRAFGACNHKLAGFGKTRVDRHGTDVSTPHKSATNTEVVGKSGPHNKKLRSQNPCWERIPEI
jgi:hypothetical protein